MRQDQHLGGMGLSMSMHVQAGGIAHRRVIAVRSTPLTKATTASLYGIAKPRRWPSLTNTRFSASISVCLPASTAYGPGVVTIKFVAAHIHAHHALHIQSCSGTLAADPPATLRGVRIWRESAL